MEPETFTILELFFAKISFQVFFEPLNSIISTPHQHFTHTVCVCVCGGRFKYFKILFTDL